MDRLLLVCLTLLPRVWSESSHSPIELPLLESSHVKLENGIDPNHLLVIECTNSNEIVQLECTITIHRSANSSDTCQTILTANEDMDDVELLSIHQLGDNKVTIVWGDLLPRKGTSSYFQSIFYTKRVTIVSMDRCTIVKTLLHRYFLGTRRRLQAVVPFDNGFDAVVTCHPYYENCTATRESYDLNGNDFAAVESLPVQLDHVAALAVVRKDRSKGIFVYGTYNYPEVNVSHVVEGKVKRSFDLRTDLRQTVSHADGEGTLAICGRVIGKARTIECTYYHSGENRVIESKAKLPGYIDVIGVRNLKNGDLLLFAVDGNTVMLVEVKNNDRPVMHYEQLTWRANAGMCKIRAFDEINAYFGLVCETHVEGNRSLVTKIFDLPVKLRERLGNTTET